MSLSRVGFAELRLCTGHVPMYKEMVELSYPIMKLMVEEFGIKEVVRRFSNPYWFQSLALAMGFEHNYTGATTVTLKALKEAINNKDIGIRVVGGKGREATSLPSEVDEMVEEGGIEYKVGERVKSISRETAKSDNSLLQDSFDIYFHSVIVGGRHFAVINQGMNEREQLVRRYHWYDVKDIFRSNNSASFSDKISLRMDGKERRQEEVRKAIVDLVHDYEPSRLEKKALLLRREMKLVMKGQKQLFMSTFDKIREIPYYLYFPKTLNMKAIEVAREAESFKEVFSTPGLGKSTMRGLAYLSSLIYGTEVSWENPQQYCYAFGTKAARPWYVERQEMRKAAKVLREVLEGLDVETQKKRKVLKRLSSFIESKNQR